jgi:hypothetical protein
MVGPITSIAKDEGIVRIMQFHREEHGLLALQIRVSITRFLTKVGLVGIINSVVAKTAANQLIFFFLLFIR